MRQMTHKEWSLIGVLGFTRFVFPFMEDGTFDYVSGMYTALLRLFPASYGLDVTLREVKNATAPSTRKLPPSAYSS
jgi:hypothetical protein